MWEITGAEFSKSEAHTADGISIRFPRCTRIRDDKDWKSATNLPQLKVPAPGLRVCPVPPSQLWHPGHLPSCVLVFFLQRAERGQEGSYWKRGAARPPGERSACIRRPRQPWALSHSLLGRTSLQASGSTLLRGTGEQRTVICADYCRNRAGARKALRKPAAFACCVSSRHFPQPRAPKTDHTGCLSPEAGKGGITRHSPPSQELYQLSKERAAFAITAGDEGSSATGGSSGENEGTSGPAVPHAAPRASPKQPPTSAKKAGGKPGGCTNRGGKEGGRGLGHRGVGVGTGARLPAQP